MLAELHVADWPWVTDAAICEVASSCRELRVLSITWCTGVTDSCLRGVGAHCATLEQLHVYKCSGMVGDGLAAVMRGCPALTELDISETHFTTAALMSIAEHGQRLRKLDMRSMDERLTDDVLRAIMAGCPLASVTAALCGGVSAACSEALRALYGTRLRTALE